ncbi:hypothetical protein CJF30_00000282 [Rutstroemia sp. NJR-2017a BBW]|nr:hypothetical protein CJF30_00000282 [Rutstroemia sp. NJR-2017a BBW]
MIKRSNIFELVNIYNKIIERSLLTNIILTNLFILGDFNLYYL